jgi:hypothetical protein
MEPLSKIWRWLGNNPHQLIGIRVLQVALGAKLLFDTFTLLPFATFLWGPHGIGWGSTKPVLGPILGNLFDRLFQTDACIFYILSVLVIGALWLVIGYNTRFAILLALVPFFLLRRRLPEITDGGDNLTQIVLIYMLFLLPNRAKFSSGQFRVWLHNIGVLAIILQLVIVYFIAGFAKANGDWWQQGVALYYITQVQWFTLPGANVLFTNPWLVTIATYGSMFYELMFPTAIISRLKLPWILFGILFHIGIAVIMGMVSFATVMSGLDLFLISDQEYVQIWQRGQLLLAKLARLPMPAHRISHKTKQSILERSERTQTYPEEALKIPDKESDCVGHEQSG